ncbi:hypothetical protein RM572_04215 [Streptomyces sp. DSM 42041]|uniref:Gram-positive cocci surface proteins LPxTG domain-containing protein n=1 Tax=Streptomyces hazeniae TaxID=3075538 RepID=A0ABU2NLW7_9ACTN|nr:hypothetical protein [Streptomyces sp. DSM 42041]MDT0377979.1 hypothetical protein [Streptomyces sp. DSM 42041]
MRRARLVAAAFAGTVCLTTLAPAAAVAAEPVAEVSPRRVHPGGTVTITVTCGKHDEQVAYLTAYSQAFAEGEAKLRLLPRGGDYGKPTYQGRAHIAGAHAFSGSVGSDGSDGSSGREESSGSFESSGSYEYGSEDTSGSEGAFDAEGSYQHDSEAPGSAGYDGDGYGSDGAAGKGTPGSGDSYDPGAGRHGKSWGINGSCPDGKDFTTSVFVEHKPRGGAHAGLGGGRDEVDTAVVAAGGALLSLTVGLGVYVLRRRRSGA